MLYSYAAQHLCRLILQPFNRRLLSLVSILAYRQSGIASQQQLCTHWPIGRVRRLSEILYL